MYGIKDHVSIAIVIFLLLCILCELIRQFFKKDYEEEQDKRKAKQTI